MTISRVIYDDREFLSAVTGDRDEALRFEAPEGFRPFPPAGVRWYWAPGDRGGGWRFDLYRDRVAEGAD